MFNQVLRPVQSSTLTTRISNSYRGLKISDLPPSSKLSDAHLRQSLFTEFRRCGRIQSVVLPPTNGSTNTTRLAIVTFRRAEEAECAYQAIQGGAKVLFSTPVSVELHPGSNGNDELSSIKRSSVANTTLSSGNNTKLNSTSNSDTTGSSLSTSITTTTTTQPGGMNKTLNSHSTDDHLINNNNHQTMLNKSPTRTLHVAGLTVGPTGPVTSEQLTTAFRKFGDIINVQLKPTSNSALIQFAEMRGPIRAMNAHAREPLRLGGRPLTLAYTPSIPTTSLWISDLPASLASLTDEELLHTLSQIAPVQEIALINRMDQSTRNQSTPSISTSPHCAAYIKLHSTEHAIRLLTELRSSKRYSLCPQTAPITTSASATTTTALNKPTSRRPIAVDFASPRQSSIVTNLQLNASSRRHNKTPSVKSSHKSKSIGPQENKRSVKLAERSSSSKCDLLKGHKSLSTGKPTENKCSKQTDSLHSSKSGDSNSSWLTDAPSDSSFVQQPLRVMTMTSSVLSPIRSSAASSGGLSSPGGSSSSITGNNNSSIRRTPNNGGETVSNSCQSEFVGPSPNHHSSLRLSTFSQPLTHTPTVLAMSEFRVSPTPTACSVSASSGVSSGGPSFSSTNSSGGGSTGSSPLTNNNSTTNHFQSAVISKSNSTSQIKVTSSSPLLKRNISHVGQSNCTDSPHCGNTNKSRTFNDSFSSLKLHLSSNTALASSSPGSNSPLCCTSSTTTPLTVSIKLTGINRSSQPTNLISPCSLSENTEMFVSSQDKQCSESLPLTPVSAPPLRCKSSRHTSIIDPRRRRVGVNAPDVSGTTNDLTDWWSCGSPVYESMYDKIKRRTNKEAEERRQRQLEAFSNREKSGKKQRKKEQSTKSPPSSNNNNIPVSSPDSFNTEQCGKLTNTFSLTGKSHHPVNSKYKLSDTNNRSLNKRHANCQKTETTTSLDDSNHHSQWRSTRLDKICRDTTNESHLYSRRMSRNLNSRTTKRRRSIVSSLSSSLSSEGECRSNSPPETLTRLSLGMRFPVSATYHECIRPAKPATFAATTTAVSNRKWSNHPSDGEDDDDDDDALSQLSSSLSCSTNDSKLYPSNPTKHKLLHFSTNKSKSTNVCSFNSSPLIHRNHYDVEIRSSESNKKSSNIIPTGLEMKTTDNKSKLCNNPKQNKSCKQSKRLLLLPSTINDDRQKSSADKKMSFVMNNNHNSGGLLKRQRSEAPSSRSTTTDLHPNKRKRVLTLVQKNINEKNSSNKICNNHTSHHHQQKHRHFTSSKHSASYRKHRHHISHSPKPYFSDDGTILDSEAEDVKGSFVSCSDSVSHTTTGTSDQLSMKDSYHHRNDRHISSVHSDETDESNLFSLDSHIHSPNTNRCHSVYVRKQKKRFSNNLGTVNTTTTTNTTNLQSRDPDGDSTFDALLDSDRFSANSKSTISTEPMEQCELDEDDDLDMNSTCLKFTDGDDDGDYEWRSGIASSSPNPVHLEFDEDVVDDDDNDEVGCELLDSKPEPNTITFQSDSFAEKLSNSIMASSDEEKPQDTLRLQSVDMNQHSSSSSTPSCIVGTDEKTVDDSFDILSNNNDLHDENKLNRCDSSPTLLNKLSPICGDDGGNQHSHSDDHIPIKSETDKQILSSIEESSVIIPSPNPNELKHNKLENCSPSLLPTNNASQCLPVHSFDNSSCNSKHDNVLTVSDHSNTIVATNSFNKPSIENNTNNDSTSIICTTSLNNPMDAIKTSLFDSTHSETSVIVKNSNVTREATKIKLSSKNDVFHQISCISTSPNLTNSTSTVSHDAVSVNSMCALPKLLNSSLILDNKPPVNTKTVSDKSSETVIQVDHTTPRQASSNNVVKPAISTLSSSISLNSQPTEVHDITRYVQSVIERVKAERVEENQQAAAAAAHCHHSTVPVMTIPISTLSTVSLNQTPKVYHEQTTLPGTTSSHNRRSYSGQRRSLLVTVSTCSPMKTSISSRSAKLISPNALVSSHPVTTTCNIVDDSSVHMTNSTISSTPGLSHPKISTDLQLPSIPGVNACAPLNLPVIQLNNDNTSLTRQSSGAAFDNLQLPSKRSDICHNNLDAPTTSLPVNAASRRQRRSENKATSNALPVLKDNTIFSFSAPAVLTSSTTVNPSLISVSSVPSTVVCSKSTEVNILNNPVMSTSCAQVPIHISGTLSSIDCVQKVKSSNIRTSVDPYEPNFDEESPVGFHPVQLHPHRSPSLCPSPNPINQSRNKTPYSTAVNITAASSQPLPSTPLVVASSPPVSNFSSGLVILDSKSIRNAEIVACTTTSSLSASEASSVSNIQPSFCVTSSQSIDTVDEVISDVCAGHFDVQSYLKSWSCNTVGTTVSTSNIQQPKVAINNVLPPHESIALSNIVTSISSCTPTVITSTATNTSTINGTTTNQPFQSVNPALVTNISNTPTGIPFPLPITSEPIVAAVTIPTGKASNLGKNDSNNAINIGTGSAVLNTLLAALQLIPGSQVTVTGPAAAAGVVGNLAVNNSRTISAATITLPVNAAQQAAANIKAAVLSVTNANNNQGKAINTNWNQQHQDSSNMKKTINECNNETKVSHAIFIPPVCVVTSAHLTSTAQNRQTASTHQTNTTTNSTSVFPTCPVTVAQLPLNNIHMNSSMNSASSQQHSKTLPSGCIVNDSVTSVTTTASQLYQLQMTVEPSVAKPHLTSTGATTVTNTMTITNSISSSTCDQPFNATSVLASCGKYTSVTPTPISHHSPLIMSQQSNICTTKQSFIPPTSPTIINGPIHPQMTTRTVSNAPLPPSPPVMPGRNSSNVSSITNPVLQTLIDRLGGNVEPSVAIALFHAALNGSNMRRNLNDSPTDIQVNPYLRHVAQQFLDNRGCSGSLKPSMPISHSESQVHSTSVCAKSLSPSLTMQQIPVTNMNYTSSPHRPPASGLPFVSPIRINPVDSDISQVDPTVNNIISPPVVAARLPVSDQPPPINNNNATPNSDVQSCNTLGSSYPLVWQGRLSLKNIETRVALHFIQGNHNLLNACMTLLASGGGGQPQFSLITSGGPLRIVQRMRLEPAQLEGVQRKLNQDGASCACLALPTGSSPVELAQQTQILNENFIRYMQEKMAAGIINVGHPDYQQTLTYQ
ncbi:split ends Protein [Schistosoma japonicum]|nr:split ends Protein [Schistosoma japonicum]